MADRLYLSLRFPSFEEVDMMPRALSVLKQFPFSVPRPGVGYLAVHGISWNEPPVFEQTFDSRVTPEQAVELAGEHVHAEAPKSLLMKYLPRGVPAYFSPIARAKSSTELRGRWFTTRCWAFPAALR